MKYIVYLFLVVYLSALCVPETGVPDLLIHENYYVCFILNGNERSVFYPSVDQYGRFIYKNLYEKVKESGNDITYIQLAIGTKGEDGEPIEVRSVPKLYNGLKYAGSFFTFLTAVINVDNGIVKSIDWDDGCYTCLQCEENSIIEEDGVMQLIEPSSPYYSAYQGKNCMVEKSKCDDNTNCDLTIYLVWSGSDSKGRVFQSANLRMSRFQSGSIESIVNTLK